MLWTLALCIGFNEPQFTITPNFSITIKKVEQPKIEPPKQTYTYPFGYHEHQCICGYRWGHSSGVKGSPNDHKCARCGRMVWEVSPGIKLPPQQPIKYQQIINDCPT